MATKLRLQRHGKKGRPYYHIVAADERAKRDGKYIERIGSYNPNTNPATMEIEFDRALYWVGVGAQPTDTCRAILSYKGVMYKNHLNKGVTKGALTQEEADKKFEAWLAEKDAKIQAKVDGLDKASADKLAAQLATEKKQNEERAAAIAAANAPEVEEVAEEEAVEATEEAAEETVEATEEAAEETVEASTEEAAEEVTEVKEEAAKEEE